MPDQEVAFASYHKSAQLLLVEARAGFTLDPKGPTLRMKLGEPVLQWVAAVLGAEWVLPRVHMEPECGGSRVGVVAVISPTPELVAGCFSICHDTLGAELEGMLILRRLGILVTGPASSKTLTPFFAAYRQRGLQFTLRLTSRSSAGAIWERGLSQIQARIPTTADLVREFSKYQ